ncbi:protein-tyrosine phosphatase-like protein [Neurospora tetraspora]|uniref:protein-tyrosine-phosphatase n=1 Tax=Neurospora tetraspora TaxID=94610 RepID=A0AAE0MRQ6_9PEZI|nr:protein-tyrosine phosphatase-like protein [Neurospora tetraspora]
MSPPPAPIGHGSSSEYQPTKRRKSSSSSTRSSGYFAAAIPTVSVPAPTYSGHHRPSSASRDDGSPRPGSSSPSTFVLPPGVSISQITPNVFVGNNASSTSIQTLMHYGITSMVSLLSTAEQQLNEEAWNSPALDMLVPKSNRLFVRCEDSPEEDLVGRLGMICEFVEEQVERRKREKSVEEVLENVLPASEVPKGFNTNVGQEPKPRQRVRSLIPDEEGRVEGPTPAQPAPAQQGAEEMAELTRQQKSRRESAPAPQRQRVRSLIPDDVEPAGGPSTSPKPIPSLPSGSIPCIPSAPVPSLPGQGQLSTSHLSPYSTPCQLSALSPSAQAGPSTSTSRPTSSSTQSSLPTNEGGKVLIHCNQGVSRSGAACVAYMMKQHPNWSAEKALRFVQLRRKEVEPSENFMAQLEVWGQCGFEVWEEEDTSSTSGKGLEVDGKSIDGKKSGKKKKVPKGPYRKWLEKREEWRRRVGEMGGLVLPPQDQV